MSVVGGGAARGVGSKKDKRPIGKQEVGRQE